MPRNIETLSDAEIIIRLSLRKLGIKAAPLPSDSPPAQLDVEDGYYETVETPKSKPSVKKVDLPTFDSEPE